jgi:hypothetical protein
MELLRSVAFYALLSAPIAFALGPRWRRQLVLAAVAIAYVVVGYGYAYTIGCPEEAHTCGPGLVLIVGGITIVGWLVGIGLGVALRALLRTLRAQES